MCFNYSICWLLVACGSYPEKQGFLKQDVVKSEIRNLYFSNPDVDYVYKANIEVFDKIFGGIFIVKKIATNNHRIVFTTELGNKLFDFSFINHTFKVNYILDDLNKGILINILKKDFKVLIQEQLNITNIFTSENRQVLETSINNKKHYYFVNQFLDKVVRVKNGKEKVVFLFTKINDNVVEQIHINHSDIKLKINFKSIVK